MKSVEFRRMERIRSLIRALSVTGFILALLTIARAHAAAEGDASPTPLPEATEGAATLDKQGNIVTPTPAPTTPGVSTPIPTPWIAPPPHSRGFHLQPNMVAGFAIILLGISFFWAEAHATSHGVLGAAGVLCVLAGLAFIFGYTLLAITISWSAVGPLVVAVIVLMGWTVYKGIKQMDEMPIGDLNEYVGRIVKASGALKPEGKVFLDGTLWNAISTRPVGDGKNVRIISTEGLTLRVEPVEE